MLSVLVLPSRHSYYDRCFYFGRNFFDVFLWCRGILSVLISERLVRVPNLDHVYDLESFQDLDFDWTLERL
jgi:hypothetical protein